MKIINKRAPFDYQLIDKFEAGIRLFGGEVKAVKLGHADLTGSFVKVIGNEAYLVNATVFPYAFAGPTTHDQRRTRKLLMHRKEIISLKSKTDASNLTIVPVSVYTTHGLIKVELALGKPKKKVDKKEALRRRDIDREIDQVLKNRR